MEHYYELLDIPLEYPESFVRGLARELGLYAG